MRIFRTDSAVASALVWATLLQLALQLMLFPVLTKRLGLGSGTGIVAGSAWILSGIPPIYVGESTLAALLIICAAFLMERSLRTEITRSQLLLWGMVWGILLLLQPVVTVVLLAWTFVLHFRSQHSRLQKLALATLPLVMVTPWLIRNFVVFHRPVFIRDKLGLELAVSNNSCAQGLFDANDRLGCFSSTHPNMSSQEALKVREMGEVEYNHVGLNEALHWIRRNPNQFGTLTAERMRDFWFPPRASNNNNGTVWNPKVLYAFTLLGIPRLFLMWRNAPDAAYVVGFWLMFFPVIYYVIQVMDRRRYPILWASYVGGSYFISEFAHGLVSGRTDETSQPDELAPGAMRDGWQLPRGDQR